MAKLTYRDLQSLLMYYNDNVTYSSQFKCKVYINFNLEHKYVPGASIYDKKYYLYLVEYAKLKDSVYKEIMIGLRIFDRLESCYLFVDRAVSNGCNFSGMDIYLHKKKK